MMPITAVEVDTDEPGPGGARGRVLPVVGFLLIGLALICAALRIAHRHRASHPRRRHDR